MNDVINCSVCLEEVNENVEKTIKLECNHVFHSDCVMFLNNVTCPNCRADSVLLENFVVNPIEKLNELAIIMSTEYTKYISAENDNYSEHINNLNRLCSEELYMINSMYSKKHAVYIGEIQSYFSALLELLNICGSSEEENFGDLEILYDILKSMSLKIELNYINIKFGDVEVDSDSLNSEEDFVAVEPVVAEPVAYTNNLASESEDSDNED